MSDSASPPGAPAPAATQFGTFTGVFTPTLLTILGVILYVRMGWVVGNAGLGGAFLILGLGILITTCTGLSLSSIATNTRIGAGGPYSILNKSLGLEVGGSVGIPLFLTRPLGVAMYVIGFREGVLWIVPDATPILVDLGVFLLLFGIAFKSAALALRTQYLLLAVIGASLVSVFGNLEPFRGGVEIQWWGHYPGAKETGFEGTDFWGVFAVFFPATTGILAGVSGRLRDPRRAIPRGTMAAIGLSAVVYFSVAWWSAKTGSLETLTTNYNHLIDNALFPPLVIAGLLGATMSSALAGLVSGPRILMAMGQNHIIPYSEQMAAVTKGEPRNAILVTGVLALLAMMVRDLNALAPLVTMFFLITYCMINVVVLIEGSLGLVSYRPTLHVPLLVPFIGLLGCLFSMFIVSPVFSLVSVSLVVALYLFIRRRRRGVAVAKEDVRSSIFVAVAEWAAGRVTPEDLDNVRAWKPHLLVPAEDAEEVRGAYRILVDLARPEGTIKLLGVGTDGPAEGLAAGLERSGRSMRRHNVLAAWTVIDLPGYVHGVSMGLMALQGAFFRPNVLFLRLAHPGARRGEQVSVIQHALEHQVGVVLFSPHPAAGLGEQRDIHLWVRRGWSSWDANEAFESGNLNLILLMGFRLWRLWRGELSVMTVIDDPADRADAERFLRDLCDLARFPTSVKRRVQVGDFNSCLRSVPPADLSIFGLQREAPDLAWAENITATARSSSLFVLDSGHESARA